MLRLGTHPAPSTIATACHTTATFAAIASSPPAAWEAAVHGVHAQLMLTMCKVAPAVSMCTGHGQTCFANAMHARAHPQAHLSPNLQSPSCHLKFKRRCSAESSC